MASSPGYHDLIASLLGYIDTMLAAFVFDGYTAVMGYIAGPLGLAVIVLVTCLGYGVVTGKLDISPALLLQNVIKISLIYGFALSWGQFSSLVIPVFQDAAAELGGVLLKATQPGFTGNIFDALQHILDRFVQTGWALMTHGGFSLSGSAIASRLIGLFFLLFGILLTAIAAFQLVFAKVMMACLFALAPLFISFTLFQVTRTFFDRWLGALASYSFLIILVSVTIALSMSLMNWAFQTYIGNDTMPVLGLLVPVVFVAIIAFGVTLGAQRLADSLSSTVTSLSGASMVGGAIGGFIGGAFGTSKTLLHAMTPGHGGNAFTQGAYIIKTGMAKVGALGSQSTTAYPKSQGDRP
jgi:type IV secretion system protein VirB6